MQSRNKKTSKDLSLLSLDEVLHKVASFEGFRSFPYGCPAGVLTIGYGHTQGVKLSDRVSKDEAFELLRADFLRCQSLLLQSFDVKDFMNSNQIYALTDFVFNCGIGTLLRSSAAPFLKDYHSVSRDTLFNYDYGIVSCLLKYNKYRKDGKLVVSSGLQKRRQWETSLYLSS